MTASPGIESWADILAFSAMMIAALEFLDAKEVQDYYEKPDNWYPEREAWVDAGRPVSGTNGWPDWLDRLEKMLNGEDLR